MPPEQQLQVAIQQLQQQQQEIQALHATNLSLQQQIQQQQPSLPPSSNPGPLSNSNLTRVKIAAPPYFFGKVGTEIDGWLNQMELQLDYYGSGIPDGKEQVKFAACYFRDAALTWWVKDPNNRNIVTWQQFKRALMDRFLPLDAAISARQKLRLIRQGFKVTVTQYAELFQRTLIPITDMSETDKINYFITGLQPQLMIKVMEKKPTTLMQAIMFAVERETFNNYARTYGAIHNSTSGRVNTFQQLPSSLSSTSSSSNDAMDLSMISDNYGDAEKEFIEVGGSDMASNSNSFMAGDVVLAKLEAMQQQIKALSIGNNRSGYGSSNTSSSSNVIGSSKFTNGNRNINSLSPEERERRRIEKLCYHCGGKNHISRNCPKKMNGNRFNGGNSSNGNPYRNNNINVNSVGITNPNTLSNTVDERIVPQEHLNE